MSSTGGVQFVQSDTDLKFALASVKNGSATDLHMHLQVPQQYGWGAVAIGDMMNGATMFIVYPSSGGTSATLSVRTATGHFEPAPLDGLTCNPDSMSTTDSLIDAAFTCYGLGSDKRLTSNPSQTSWLYAAGPPGNPISSNSIDASISQHSRYGTFQLNMLDAIVVPTTASSSTSATAFPTAAATATSALAPFITGSASVGSSSGVAATSPSTGLVNAHAILLGGSFLVLFPLGVFFLRLHSVRFHWVAQMLASLACLCGLIIAVTMCATTTEYAGFDAGHQILGLLTVALLVPQALLGWRGHVLFKQRRRSSWFGVAHLNFGRLIVVMGIVTAVLGFTLAGDTSGAVAFGVVAGVVVLAVAALAVWDRRARNTRRDDMGGMEMLNEVRKDHSKIKVVRTEATEDM